MPVKTFAAIDVGSYEVSLKIFEVLKKKGMREIDHIRYSIDMGTETYAHGKLSYERVDELCKILNEFADIMQMYHVEEYKAYGTSAIRESENAIILLDQIKLRTGIKVEVLSNSEQRFLDYKSIAFKGEEFQRIIEKGTAIVDIGGGSIQISLFDKDTLVVTQNMKLGVLRLQDKVKHLNASPAQYQRLIGELVDANIKIFKKMYLKDREINNVIVVDDYISAIVMKLAAAGEISGYANSDTMKQLIENFHTITLEKMSKKFDLTEEKIRPLFISSILLVKIMEAMNAEYIWVPGVTLCDGIAYEYAEKKKIIRLEHDFEKDIIACAKNIGRRYQGSKNRDEAVANSALTIFDSMKKVHGLGKRERLLLNIAALLHDCGAYINMESIGECSYNIIMSTEIIGLSHVEREMVANIVKYSYNVFDYYRSMPQQAILDKQAYLIIAKLNAILRLAAGLDRSHKQKCSQITSTLKEDKLIITAMTSEDILLEKGLFEYRADFFEEVYSIRPILKKREPGKGRKEKSNGE